MILAILQARMSSSRLPGKVLKKVQEKPLLEIEVNRVLQSERIDKLILATSTDPTDDLIYQWAIDHNIGCYRGSLEDVLDRYYQCAKMYAPKHVIRITGDCPLISPEIIDRVIQAHVLSGSDYTSNTIEPTHPDGLDVEIMTFSVLEDIWKKSNMTSQREHVTKYIYDHPNDFKINSVKDQVDHSKLRWTVDNEEDYQLIKFIAGVLDKPLEQVSYQEILGLYDVSDNLEALQQNSMHKRNEGTLKSI